MGKLNHLPTIANMLYPNQPPLDLMPLPSVNLYMPTPTHAPNLFLFAIISPPTILRAPYNSMGPLSALGFVSASECE